MSLGLASSLEWWPPFTQHSAQTSHPPALWFPSADGRGSGLAPFIDGEADGRGGQRVAWPGVPCEGMSLRPGSEV